MSTWRRKAIEAFPDFRREFEQPDTTIYQVFFELLPRVQDAHARNDTEELQRIYDFADWYYHQKANDICNAAGVAFYEHLVDEPITRSEIARWCSQTFSKAVKVCSKPDLSQTSFASFVRNIPD